MNIIDEVFQQFKEMTMNDASTHLGLITHQDVMKDAIKIKKCSKIDDIERILMVIYLTSSYRGYLDAVSLLKNALEKLEKYGIDVDAMIADSQTEKIFKSIRKTEKRDAYNPT
jgi:hypothetical protein